MAEHEEGRVTRIRDWSRQRWERFQHWLRRALEDLPLPNFLRGRENQDPEHRTRGHRSAQGSESSSDLESASDRAESEPGRGQSEPRPELSGVAPEAALEALEELSRSPEDQFLEDLLDATRATRSRHESAEGRTTPSPLGGPMADEHAADIEAELELELPGGIGGGPSEQVPLEIHVHTPDRRTRPPVRGGRRSAEKGLVPTRFDRYAIDGRIFERRKPGGSVLIDASGSMRLDPEQVRESLDRFPALTIAKYSGGWDTGRLCVLADKGNLGDLEECGTGGGNDVDIESLAWLARQPEPRVWVSDGFVVGGLVTALGGREGMANELIRGLCTRRKIIRVDSFEDAIKVLERGTARGVGYLPRDQEFLPEWR